MKGTSLMLECSGGGCGVVVVVDQLLPAFSFSTCCLRCCVRLSIVTCVFPFFARAILLPCLQILVSNLKQEARSMQN